MADQLASLREALVGRYALERELGRGGMATVFLARDVKHDRPVALKVLHPELAATLGTERFQSEIRFAARLQHPHILTVLDSGDAAGQLWFTMPFVEGESLRDRLSRERQLPVELALQIGREAARALDYAHQHGIVHRDIKPENILLTKDGSTLVADFGIARALGADDRITQTGMALGTPAYMSPEQAAGERGVDARTDIYSLGAVLYEMLAGETPFTGPTVQSVIAKRMTERAPSVRLSRPTVPEEVDQAIQRALAPVPADRFADAGALARALAAAPSTTVASSSDATVVRPAARSARRPVPVLAITLIAGFVLGVGVLFAWRHTRAPEGSAEEGARVLAVLPFESLGDSSDAYFAGGLTDEIRGKLAQLPGIEVIARGSSNEYRGSSKRAQEIARELGAGYLLTGTVRWEKSGAGSRVRVIPELVEVSPGKAPRSRWQEPFDAALTNVFEVQAGIAAKVANALGVALADSVRSALVSRPTGDLAAYDAYLQGEAASQGMAALDAPSIRRGIELYGRAVSLDSAFVPAWARLSQGYSLLYTRGAPTAALADQAKRAAERARTLAPDRAEGYLALGEYYRQVTLEYPRALATFEAGLKLAPNNVDLIAGAGLVDQVLGRWESSVRRLERAEGLDPRSFNAAKRYAYTLLVLRRYGAADVAIDRAIGLSPTDVEALQRKVMVAVARGDLDGARRILRAAPTAIDRDVLIAFFANFEDLWWLLDDAQQRRLLTLPPSAFDDDRGAWALVMAQVYHHRGDDRRARVYADSAVIGYAGSAREQPTNGQLHVLLGLALAYAGRQAEAVREGERGVELQPMSGDGYFGPYIQQQLARIYMLGNHQEKVIDLLEPLLRVPHTLSPGWLRIDPTWDPLRQNPRFRKLVEAS